MDILQHLPTLFMLVLLQAILGTDNLLYISIESKKVELSQQKYDSMDPFSHGTPYCLAIYRGS